MYALKNHDTGRFLAGERKTGEPWVSERSKAKLFPPESIHGKFYGWRVYAGPDFGSAAIFRKEQPEPDPGYRAFETIEAEWVFGGWVRA